MQMNIKVKYLNWDLVENININNVFFKALFNGDVLNIDNKNYRDLHEYELTTNKKSINEILENVFMDHNRVDNISRCRLEEDQRSMCIGDLIYIDDVGYVVRNIGFKKIFI